jgi:hypothetical protein
MKFMRAITMANTAMAGQGQLTLKAPTMIIMNGQLPNTLYLQLPTLIVMVTGRFSVGVISLLQWDPACTNVYGLTKDGNDLPNFPFNTNGNHGFTSVADLDGDGQFELIHPGPTADGNPWMGFIYAFKADGSQLPGFPLRPKGWLLYSGVNLGDVTGDGMLNLVALGAIGLYSGQDSIAISVFNTNIPIG